MYSKIQDEFAKGFAIFLLLILLSGALILGLLYLLPASAILFPPVPRWLTATLAVAWPLGCALAAIRLRKNKWIERWVWSRGND